MGHMLLVERHPTAARFRLTAGEFLERREAEHNLQFGIVSHAIADESLGIEADPLPYFATVHDEGAVVGAALMTPPYNVVISCLDPAIRDAAAASMAADLASFGTRPPGALGPVDEVRAFADAWCARHGLVARRTLAERIYRLERVRTPSGVPGGVRHATPDDRDMLVGWIGDFMVEAMGSDPNERRDEGPRDIVARSLDRGQGTIFLWEHDGAAVSLAIAHGETPHGIRIGPVYTPPAARSRGFGSAVTAAASQAAIDSGRRFVFLFTDLANPTSNKIYQAIGYEPVIDVDQLAFERP